MTAVIGHVAPMRHDPVLGGPKVRDAVKFILIWAGVLLLAIGVEVGSLYFVQLIR